MLEASDRILNRDTLKEKVDSLKAAGKRVVFTNGCFDLLHIGHVRYLQAAQKQGDCLVVAVNSDRSVQQIKEAGRPIVPDTQRAEVVAALACVDWVTLFDELDPLVLIKLLAPDVLVKGADWPEKDIVGAKEVKDGGGQVVRIPFEGGLSTSGLIERIQKVMHQGKK